MRQWVSYYAKLFQVMLTARLHHTQHCTGTSQCPGNAVDAKAFSQGRFKAETSRLTIEVMTEPGKESQI